MATINYSGSQDITGCTITTWTTTTYYSFKLTEDCKLSISGTPAINARGGDEFVIQVNEPYIFDRETKVMLSYPEPTAETVLPSTQEKYDASDRNFSIAAGSYYQYCTLIADREYTSGNYDVFTFGSCYIVANETGVVTRLMYDGNVLATRSDNYSAGVTQKITLSASPSVTIPKNGVVTLEMEGSGSSTIVKASFDNSLIRITDTA